MPAKPRYRKMKSLVSDGSARNIDALRMERPARKFFSHDVEHLDIVEEAEAVVRDLVHDVERYATGVWLITPPIDIKLGWENWRSRSHGGRYEAVWRTRLNDHDLPTGGGINLCMRRHVPTVDSTDDVTAEEYKRMRPWGDLGDWKGSWRDDLKLNVLHECSHAIAYSVLARFYPGLFLRMTRKQRESYLAENPAAATLELEYRGHGLRFCQIYSTLRHRCGLVDHSKPIWGNLTEDCQQASMNWKRAPADLTLWLEVGPAKYQREHRRRVQKARRAAKKVSQTENGFACSASCG